jgi:CRISPR-associated protein Cmr1
VEAAGLFDLFALARDEDLDRILLTSMREITLTLETVTPMFLGGADPRGAPELRAPSFRGAMRYWLRALVGAAGEQLMRQREDYLFGVGGEQAAAGVINLRVTSAQFDKKSYTDLSDNTQGISYVWFSARKTKREEERSAIMPFQCQLKLSLPRSKQLKTDLEQALAILALLTRLGGVGSRSRRFAGAVQVAKIETNDNLPSTAARLLMQSASPNELAQEISSLIQVARGTFGIHQLTNPAPDQFDVLHPEVCQIFVLNDVFKTWRDAVEEVGRIYRRFRELRQPDYDVVKTAMSQSQDLQGEVKRAAFGLPIPFFFRSLKNGTAVLQAEQYREDNTSLRIDRRASPLWMRVVKLSNGQYTVVFTWFKSRFLPPHTKFVLTKRGKPDLYGQQLPNDQLIPMFLNGIDQQNHSSLKDAGYSLLSVQL